jgi:hypothetical protein
MPWYIHVYNIGWSLALIVLTYYLGFAYMLLMLYIVAAISLYWIG